MLKSVLSMVVFGSLMAAGCVGMEELTGDQNQEAKVSAPKLNLSHIECTEDGQVLAHFVLLFAGTGTPGDLTGTYNDGEGSVAFGPVAPGKNTGNVWHYNVLLPTGWIDITSATTTTSKGASVSLHNPDEYAGDYQCGEVTTCELSQPVPESGVFCSANPLGSEDSECGAFGLVPIRKDDALIPGNTFDWTALASARLVLVKTGSKACGQGEASYAIYENVNSGDTVSTPPVPEGENLQAISHVTYCGCPE